MIVALTHAVAALPLPIGAQQIDAPSPAAAPKRVALATTAAVQENRESEDANDIRVAVQEACRTDASLHGALLYHVDVDPANDSRLIGHLIVDSDSAERQRAAIASRLKDKISIASETRLPIARLVQSLQAKLENTFGRKGTFIQGAYCEEDENGVLRLVLFGRVPTGNQRNFLDPDDDIIKPFSEQDIAEKECIELMRATTIWSTMPGNLKLNPDARQLLSPVWDLETESLAAKLHAQLSESPTLRGTWLEIAECRDHQDNFLKYDIYTWIDPARADPQRTAVDALLKQHVKRTYRVVQERPAPLIRLIEHVNLHLASHSRYDGCQVDDGHFKPLENSLTGAVLVLRGRVTREEQSDPIIREVGPQYLKFDPAWQTDLGQFIIEYPELHVVDPASWRGVEFFQYGHNLYQSQRYAEAAAAFRNATIDAPRTAEYRYWHIVSLLQSGDTERAHAYMLALVNRKPLPVGDAAVLRALERVQGPVRQQLIQLRRRAESEYYLDKRLERAAMNKPNHSA